MKTLQDTPINRASELPPLGEFERWKESEAADEYAGQHVAYVLGKGVIEKADSLGELLEKIGDTDAIVGHVLGGQVVNAEPSASPWRPIADAPKDGTPICVAQYSEIAETWVFWQDYWRKYQGDFGEGFGRPGFAPTHWMPLPPPPTP